jgi:hypothetical protein
MMMMMTMMMRRDPGAPRNYSKQQGPTEPGVV